MALQQSKQDLDAVTDSDHNYASQGTAHKLREVVEPYDNDKMCKFCQATFAFKNGRKRHEKICKVKKEKKALIFSCSICKKEFKKEKTLEDHVKAHQTRYNCKFCNFTFSSRKNIIRHESRCIANADKLQPTFKCDHCKSMFNMKFTLLRHLQKCSIEKPLLRSKTPCLVADCKASFLLKTDLIKHFSHHHQGVISIKPKVVKTFSSFEEFSEWKEQEEESTYSYFSAKGGRNSKGTQYYYCQRDGSAKLHSQRKTSKRRNLPSIKVGQYCLAMMKLSVIDHQTVNVEYYPTHSHACKQEDQRHHPIPAAMSKFIDSKLAEGLSPKVVFELAKENFSPKNNTKVYNGRADNLNLKLVQSRARRRRFDEQNSNNDVFPVEYSNIEEREEEKKKEILWEKIQGHFAHFQAFMAQGPENVSEDQLLFLDSSFKILEPYMRIPTKQHAPVST